MQITISCQTWNKFTHCINNLCCLQPNNLTNNKKTHSSYTLSFYSGSLFSYRLSQSEKLRFYYVCLVIWFVGWFAWYYNHLLPNQIFSYVQFGFWLLLIRIRLWKEIDFFLIMFGQRWRHLKWWHTHTHAHIISMHVVHISNMNRFT